MDLVSQTPRPRGRGRLLFAEMSCLVSSIILPQEPLCQQHLCVLTLAQLRQKMMDKLRWPIVNPIRAQKTSAHETLSRSPRLPVFPVDTRAKRLMLVHKPLAPGHPARRPPPHSPRRVTGPKDCVYVPFSFLTYRTLGTV